MDKKLNWNGNWSIMLVVMSSTGKITIEYALKTCCEMDKELNWWENWRYMLSIMSSTDWLKFYTTSPVSEKT